MYKNVIDFWFNELTPQDWWKKDEHLDQEITTRFSDIHTQAKRCELFEWRKTPLGRLAEIIVLDQFSRNIYRDTENAFASDALALALAQEAVALGEDIKLSAVERSFLYLPYMHSESLKIHNMAIQIYKANGIEANYEFEIKHKNIIEQFGRYPHRNTILGRESTQEELVFLQQPGSSF